MGAIKIKPKDDVLKIGNIWEEPVRFRVTVMKEGECRANHKLGETFEFTWNTPDGICSESFVGMYPLLHSFRVLGDMRELGSKQRNIRIYTCPSRVIQFQIEAIYRCNLCGTSLTIQDNEIISHTLENSEANIHLRVCDECYNKHQNKTITW
ncbi:MAG: hypothetical protein ACFFDU_06225 [Candidatus Thorarchaeota archaeon]